MSFPAHAGQSFLYKFILFKGQCHAQAILAYCNIVTSAVIGSSGFSCFSAFLLVQESITKINNMGIAYFIVYMA